MGVGEGPPAGRARQPQSQPGKTSRQPRGKGGPRRNRDFLPSLRQMHRQLCGLPLLPAGVAVRLFLQPVALPGRCRGAR